MIKVASGIFLKLAGDFGMSDTGRVIQALPAAPGAPKTPHWTDPSPEFKFQAQAALVKARQRAAQASAAAAKSGWGSGLVSVLKRKLGIKG